MIKRCRECGEQFTTQDSKDMHCCGCAADLLDQACYMLDETDQAILVSMLEEHDNPTWTTSMRHDDAMMLIESGLVRTVIGERTAGSWVNLKLNVDGLAVAKMLKGRMSMEIQE